jgi:uncharacterized phage-associated protein
MEYKSLAIAQCILNRCKLEGINNVTPMKLLKLIYISHGYMLGRHGVPLLTENLLAFEYGPVFNSVYQAIRNYRSSNVEKIKNSEKYIDNIESKEIETIDYVISVYGKIDAMTLSGAMHKEGTPWSVARNTREHNPIISNDYIEHFYKKIISSKTHSFL